MFLLSLGFFDQVGHCFIALSILSFSLLSSHYAGSTKHLCSAGVCAIEEWALDSGNDCAEARWNDDFLNAISFSRYYPVLELFGDIVLELLFSLGKGSSLHLHNRSPNPLGTVMQLGLRAGADLCR